MKNKVKELRFQQAMKQQELAEKVGATRQTISLIEKGEYNPSLKLCLAICYALSKTLDEVFWIGEDEDE
ncbi:MAG TPA: helix-turn-helix transcriptional regulator [Atopostipes sp.]|nr:helix-turn-helix transcriptional regulator [Atopostipes sp.]